ncbi:hypothetical protein H6G89_14675 [Oscillatoria sp. FACHB-1407]|uniref:hypothetical protein n=1 Tax=Oscillatoria sp. FACHB-1407 TaxID=2692847 RepID=UPI00168980E0|nr:hypothetical protein [Oscillatoria sp. FACHB-1407]MBD2462290.1 hypothetical protein [Oscillatoria sp. FACHB-1407]
MSSLTQTDSIESELHAVCGQCIHFRPARTLTYLEGTQQVHTPSYCKLRASVDLPCLFKADSHADTCPWFTEVQ